MVNKVSNFNTLQPLSIEEIIIMDANQSQHLEISSEEVKEIKKPINTRSPAYKFFEWDDATFK